MYTEHESSNSHLCLGLKSTIAVGGCTNQANFMCASLPNEWVKGVCLFTLFTRFLFGLHI